MQLSDFTNEYAFAGFFSTTAISTMVYQDLLIAIGLGFFGGFGGYLFKLLKDYLTYKIYGRKKKDPYRNY